LAVGWLNQISRNTISDSSSIGYDGIGNRNSVTASIPGAISLSGTTVYSYDSKDQITQETSTRNGGFTDNFGYDSAGDPTTFKGVTKTYNSNNQQTGTGYGYDGNGNPTTYGGTTLTFDPENRMTAFGAVLTAGYNGDGLRAWKQNSSARTYFLYDGINPVVELASGGSVTATNTFGANGLVSRNANSTSVFYAFDSEGNVSQRSDSSANVLSNHLFGAHGSVLNGTLSDPFGYKAQAGYYADTETGLQLLTHRYYDPNTGRFLTRDPISYNGGINLYSYVTNNPLSAVDPSGLAPKDWADWLDSNLDYADKAWHYDGNEPVANFINQTVIGGSTDTVRSFSKYLRVGSGAGYAAYAEDENIYGRAAFVCEDIVTAAEIFSLLGGAAVTAGAGTTSVEMTGVTSPKPPGWTNEWE
jgi:RHS repeat-associated protein